MVSKVAGVPELISAIYESVETAEKCTCASSRRVSPWHCDETVQPNVTVSIRGANLASGVVIVEPANVYECTLAEGLFCRAVHRNPAR